MSWVGIAVSRDNGLDEVDVCEFRVALNKLVDDIRERGNRIFHSHAYSLGKYNFLFGIFCTYLGIDSKGKTECRFSLHLPQQQLHL